MLRGCLGCLKPCIREEVSGGLVFIPRAALPGSPPTCLPPQERFQVKNPPEAYIQKLKSYLDVGGVSRKVAADWMSNLGVFLSFILGVSSPLGTLAAGAGALTCGCVGARECEARVLSGLREPWYAGTGRVWVCVHMYLCVLLYPFLYVDISVGV